MSSRRIVGSLAERAKIERIVKQTLTAVRALIPLDGITVVVLSDPSGAIPELGFGGRADAGVVRLWFNPGSPAMARSLDTDLFPLLAHEMRHGRVSALRALRLTCSMR